MKNKPPQEVFLLPTSPGGPCFPAAAWSKDPKAVHTGRCLPLQHKRLLAAKGWGIDAKCCAPFGGKKGSTNVCAWYQKRRSVQFFTFSSFNSPLQPAQQKRFCSLFLPRLNELTASLSFRRHALYRYLKRKLANSIYACSWKERNHASEVPKSFWINVEFSNCPRTLWHGGKEQFNRHSDYKPTTLYRHNNYEPFLTLQNKNSYWSHPLRAPGQSATTFRLTGDWL